MTLPEITSAIKSISAGYKIVKSFNELKSDYDVKSATTELLDVIINVQNNLVSIQSGYQSLLDSKNEVERELENLKNWEAVKMNHILKQVLPGIFVYVMKENGNSPDNQYWLCANCFDTKNKKSIFQRIYSDGAQLICNSCKASIILPS